MKVRQTVDNPDSQFVAMPQTITPAGIELNPQTVPIQEPNQIKSVIEATEANPIIEPFENNTDSTEHSEKN